MRLTDSSSSLYSLSSSLRESWLTRLNDDLMLPPEDGVPDRLSRSLLTPLSEDVLVRSSIKQLEGEELPEEDVGLEGVLGLSSRSLEASDSGGEGGGGEGSLTGG